MFVYFRILIINNSIFIDYLGYQIEMARIKMIEDENLRLNQAMDKSNLGNVYNCKLQSYNIILKSTFEITNFLN